MNGRLVLALIRAGVGILTLWAIVWQAQTLADRGVFRPGNYFSYFTILSNLLGVVVLLVSAARWRRAPSAAFDLVRGAAVVYLSVTFIVVILLLSNVEVDMSLVWVDFVVHKLMPIVLLADWLIDPPATRLAPRRWLLWLAFPAVWLAYTLIRGPIVDWYPYPFLNPANGGYASVAVYCVGILLGMLAICWLVAWLGNRFGTRMAARV